MPNLTVAMAQKKGFFKDENIEAEIIRMNPNVAITALSTGDIDYCQLFGAVVGGAIAGLPVRIVAGYLDNWPMTLISQPELKSLKELKGKTLGISSFGATPDVAARLMIKQAGIDPEKEIKILALGSDAARLTALKQRVVDVVVISPPADTQMEKQGYRILARAYELFSFPYLGLGTHTRKIKEKPDEIRRVIKATIRANRFIRDNRDEAVRTLIGLGQSGTGIRLCFLRRAAKFIQRRRRGARRRTEAGHRANPAQQQSRTQVDDERSRRPEFSPRRPGGAGNQGALA